MTLAAGSSTAGPLGLLIILLLGVVTVLLVRNMNGRLRRLPPSFDEQPPAAEQPQTPEQTPEQTRPPTP